MYLFFKNDAQPSIVLGLGSFDPSDARHRIDDQEEGEEHDGEDITQDDKQAYTGNAIDEPVNPRVRLTINEPVVREEGRGDEQSVEE